MRTSARSQTLAWLVHLYTATGVLAAFFGTLAAIEGGYRESFLWMITATLVDASDGVFARLARVKEVLPGFDGARLDDIVDYLTFVFLPVLLLYYAGNLPDGWGGLVASVVLLSSAYGFGSTDAKTCDHFFTGFPSYWNIVALYLHVAGMSPVVNALILVGLSVLVFVRIGYVYPSRTPVLRTVTILGGLAWGALLVVVVLALPEKRTGLLAISLVYPAYYVVLSLALQMRRRPSLPAHS
ncbi:MAG: CDP-diacylglycerol O-phosphatidyltransferase [Vicinamibacterales bacterium]